MQDEAVFAPRAGGGCSQHASCGFDEMGQDMLPVETSHAKDFVAVFKVVGAFVEYELSCDSVFKILEFCAKVKVFFAKGAIRHLHIGKSHLEVAYFSQEVCVAKHLCKVV